MTSSSVLVLAALCGCIALANAGCSEKYKKHRDTCIGNGFSDEGIYQVTNSADLTDTQKSFAGCILKEYEIVNADGTVNSGKAQELMNEEAECMSEKGKKVDVEKWKEGVKKCNGQEVSGDEAAGNYFICGMNAYRESKIE